MDNLPNDILRNVCKYFDPKTVGRLLVNKKLATRADLFYGSIHTLTIHHFMPVDTVLKKCTNAVSLNAGSAFSIPVKLKKLKIRHVAFTRDMQEFIESLNLQEINVIATPVLIELMRKIDVVHSEISSRTSVKYKDVAFTSLKLNIDSGTPVLNPTKLTKLTILEYSSINELYGIDFSALKLQTLILRSNIFNRGKINFDSTRLAHMPLHTLHTEHIGIDFVAIDSLRELSISHAHVDLNNLDCLKYLQTLRLSYCILTGKLSINVFELELDDVPFTPFKAAAPKILACHNTDITDRDITMPLNELHLSKCYILGHLLPLTITTLMLDNVPITTEGMYRISQMPLRCLQLSNCGIKGQDLMLITKLKLHTLDISGNKIDIEYLRMLKNMKIQTFDFDAINCADLLKLL